MEDHAPGVLGDLRARTSCDQRESRTTAPTWYSCARAPRRTLSGSRPSTLARRRRPPRTSSCDPAGRSGAGTACVAPPIEVFGWTRTTWVNSRFWAVANFDRADQIAGEQQSQGCTRRTPSSSPVQMRNKPAPFPPRQIVRTGGVSVGPSGLLVLCPSQTSNHPDDSPAAARPDGSRARARSYYTRASTTGSFVGSFADSASWSLAVSSSDSEVLMTVPPYCSSAAIALSGVACSIIMKSAEVPGWT